MTPTDRQLRILRLLVAGVKLEPSSSTTKYELTITSPSVGPATLLEMKKAGWLEQDAAGTWHVTPRGRDQAEVKAHVRNFITEVSG